MLITMEYYSLSRLVHGSFTKFDLFHRGRPVLHVTCEEVAACEQRGLPFHLEKRSSSHSYTWRKPDLIAVTRGPGMGGCLSVGVTTAKAL